MPLPGSLVWRRGIKVITSPANNENESERLPSVCRRPCSRWRTPDRWWDPTDRSAVGSDEVRSGVRSSSWCCFAARILETGQQQYSHILSTQSLEGIETACHCQLENSEQAEQLKPDSSRDFSAPLHKQRTGIFFYTPCPHKKGATDFFHNNFYARIFTIFGKQLCKWILIILVNLLHCLPCSSITWWRNVDVIEITSFADEDKHFILNFA